MSHDNQIWYVDRLACTAYTLQVIIKSSQLVHVAYAYGFISNFIGTVTTANLAVW